MATVLYVADTRFPIERANGAQTMATCHALAQGGHDVTLVVRPDTTTPGRDPFAFYGLPPERRLTVKPLPVAGTAATRRAAFLIAAAALAARTAGLVYTRDLGVASFLLQMPAFRRPRLVYESHGVADVVSAEMPSLLGRPDLAPSAAKLHRLARRERRVWTRARGYVTITRTLADELTTRFGPRERVVVAPDGVADTWLGRTWPSPPAGARPIAGYAGHLYPWKGVDVLLRALALAPELDGLIVGGHPHEADRARIDALVADLGLRDRVTMTGLLPPAEVPPRLAAASILVLPNTASAISDRYTSPLKLFEYLALGRAIVASDLPSIREVLVDGVTASLVRPGDPVALAAALRALAHDPARASALGSAARQLAPRYTWRARAATIDAILAACA